MTPSRSRRVTLHDVASHSGVSYQTVSRVVNGSDHVSKITRQRVLRSIKELDYRPNRAAQSLVTRRSFTIALIAYGMNRHFGPSQMVANVQSVARGLGYNVIIANIDDISLEHIRAAVDSVSGQLVDGIIMITPVSGVRCEDLSALCQDTPLVMIDADLGSRTTSVVIDQRFGSQLVTQYLIDLGHRQFAEISGPLNWFGATARHESWISTLRAAGLRPGPSVEGDWTSASGYAAARRLLDQGVPFTALVVGNDQMALGALRALRERGLRVPEDVSVVGFDDIPESAYFEPPLTTVRQDFAMLGRQSVEYLISLIDQPDTPVHQRVLSPQLVERLSARRI